MRLCCCRRRTPNRVEEADTKTRNQETLHYTHRDGVVTVTREYSHPSLRGTVTQRTYKSMDDVRLDSRQAVSQLSRAGSILGWGADPFARRNRTGAPPRRSTIASTPRSWTTA